MVFGLPGQRLHELNRLGRERPGLVAQIHPDQRRDLVVAGPAGAQPAAQLGADPLQQDSLECRVHVLVVAVGAELARGDVGVDHVQPSTSARISTVGQQSRPAQRAGMGARARDVVAGQAPVDVWTRTGARSASAGPDVNRPPHSRVGSPALSVCRHRQQPRWSRRAAIRLGSPQSCTKPLASDWSNASPVSYVASSKS